jgi:hypothetical protein
VRSTKFEISDLGLIALAALGLSAILIYFLFRSQQGQTSQISSSLLSSIIPPPGGGGGSGGMIHNPSWWYQQRGSGYLSGSNLPRSSHGGTL